MPPLPDSRSQAWQSKSYVWRTTTSCYCIGQEKPISVALRISPLSMALGTLGKSIGALRWENTRNILRKVRSRCWVLGTVLVTAGGNAWHLEELLPDRIGKSHNEWGYHPRGLHGRGADKRDVIPETLARILEACPARTTYVYSRCIHNQRNKPLWKREHRNRWLTSREPARVVMRNLLSAAPGSRQAPPTPPCLIYLTRADLLLDRGDHPHLQIYVPVPIEQPCASQSPEDSTNSLGTETPDWILRCTSIKKGHL